MTLKITPAQVSEVSPAAAQIVSFLAVPAATFDTEDHPSTGQKTSFLSSPGHAVALFWRLRFGKPCLFYRFRPQRLTLKITPAQVSEVSPAAAQIVSFLAVPAATFDTEDHPSTGQKTSFLSSPGHAVSLFWRLRFGKPWRQAMLFPCPEGSVVGKSFQSEVEVHLKAKSRCEIRPEVGLEAAQIVSFLAVPAATFDTEDHPSTGQKTSFLSSPGHAVSLFWRLRFGKPWRQAMLFPCPEGSVVGKSFQSEVEVRLKAKSRCDMRPEVSPEAAKIVSFLKVPAATFDTEDHPSTGQKTSFLSSPGHAVSLFWRLRFGKPWRQAMLFPCPEGSVVGKSFQSEVEVRLKAKSRCEMRPEVSPEAAKIVSFLKVPAATFDTEDHPSTGQKTSFLSSPGHAVALFWRLRFGKPCLFYRFRPQRLTLKITPAQVSEVSPAAAQIVSFLAVPAATFDTEDHPSTCQKTSFLSSPGHAVSLFWRLRFGKPWRQAMLFPCPEGSVVGKSFQSEVEVHLKAKSRCEIRPEVGLEAAKSSFQIRSRGASQSSVQVRNKARSRPWSGKNRLFFKGSGRKVWQSSPFYRFRPQRLTLKITPAQVKKRASWVRQAMLFRCFEACVLGSLDARPCCFPVPKERCWEVFPVRSRGASPKSRCEITPEVSPEAAKVASFLSVPAATFDTEDHRSTGQKTSFLSSPGHAVSLFWRLRFGKPWRQAMLFLCPEGSVVGKSFQSEVEVHLKAKSR